MASAPATLLPLSQLAPMASWGIPYDHFIKHFIYMNSQYTWGGYYHFLFTVEEVEAQRG